MGGRDPLALRRHGPDHQPGPDVGEADRLRGQLASAVVEELSKQRDERQRATGAARPPRAGVASKSAGKCTWWDGLRKPARWPGVPVEVNTAATCPYHAKENLMAKQVSAAQALPRRARRPGPERRADGPVDAGGEGFRPHAVHVQDFIARLEGSGEFVDSQALSPEGTFVRYDVAGSTSGHRRPVRGDQGPHRRLDGDRRRHLRTRAGARRRVVGSPRSRRQADPRVA